MVKKIVTFMALAVAGSLSSGAASAQDAAKGEQVFKQCMTCHRIGPDAKNLVGPVLTGRHRPQDRHRARASPIRR